MWQQRHIHSPGEGSSDIRTRLRILVVCIVLAFSAIAIRLWYLQVIKGAYYRDLSESNRVRIANIRPPRGIFYDRNGVPYVTNTPSYTITFTPEDAKDNPGVKERLASAIGMAPEDLDALIRSEVMRNPYQPIRVCENANFQVISAIEAMKDDLPGVMVQVELRRNYPMGEFAAHMVGYIGKVTPDQQKQEEYAGLPNDFLIGQYGIERAFDKVIRGEPGRRGIEVDASGRQKRVIYTTEPVAGEDLITTIDIRAQKAAEDGLEGKAGAIVAIDPNNGDVLAMASRPGFDPNIFPLGITAKQWAALSMDDKHPLNNRALQGVFPPGSTFKLAMALAGLETGKINTTDTVTCNGGFPFGNRVFHCWQKKGHGTVALHKAIVESCDVYFYRLGDKMGIDNIAKYSNYLGLGLPTGVGLREKPGLIPSTEWKKRVRHQDWYSGETISCSIGQGYVNVTPIQLARMVGTIVNGGTLYQPQVVRAIRYKDGHTMVFPTNVVGKAPVKQTNLDLIKAGMIGVVEEPGGTAHASKSDYVKIGGKTGTAQVIALGKGHGIGDKDHAWFVAAAPMDDPKIAVCILVEHGGHGGSAAAPIAKKVIEAYLRFDEQGLREKQALANRTSATFRVMSNRTGAEARRYMSNRTGLLWKKFRNLTGVRRATALKAMENADARRKLKKKESDKKKPNAPRPVTKAVTSKPEEKTTEGKKKAVTTLEDSESVSRH